MLLYSFYFSSYSYFSLRASYYLFLLLSMLFGTYFCPFSAATTEFPRWAAVQVYFISAVSSKKHIYPFIWIALLSKTRTCVFTLYDWRNGVPGFTQQSYPDHSENRLHGTGLTNQVCPQSVTMLTDITATHVNKQKLRLWLISQLIKIYLCLFAVRVLQPAVWIWNFAAMIVIHLRQVKQ